MARNKFDVDERLESPFRWKHLKRAGKYIARHKFSRLRNVNSHKVYVLTDCGGHHVSFRVDKRLVFGDLS